MDRFNQLVAEFLPPEIQHYTRDEVLSRMELAFRLGENYGLAGVQRNPTTDADGCEVDPEYPPGWMS